MADIERILEAAARTCATDGYVFAWRDSPEGRAVFLSLSNPYGSVEGFLGRREIIILGEDRLVRHVAELVLDMRYRLAASTGRVHQQSPFRQTPASGSAIHAGQFYWYRPNGVLEPAEQAVVGRAGGREPLPSESEDMPRRKVEPAWREE